MNIVRMSYVHVILLLDVSGKYDLNPSIKHIITVKLSHLRLKKRSPRRIEASAVPYRTYRSCRSLTLVTKR